MEDVIATVFCEICETKFNILARNYEKVVQEDQPILCTNCFDRIMAEHDKADMPERRQFEYTIVINYPDGHIENERLAFALYGQDGWELIQIVNNKAYFKRELVKGLN